MMRRPVITEERMQVFLQREGDRATGTVEFPHPTRGRVVVPIDYRRVDPPSLPGRGQGEGVRAGPASSPVIHGGRASRPGSAPADSRQPTADSHSLSPRAALRLEAVELADKLTAAYGPRSRGAGLAKAVEILRSERRLECTVRSIQLWARRLDVHGPQGLEDNYQPRPHTVLGCSADTAQKALTVLGYWCYRIGNLAKIDSQVMHEAAKMIGHGFAVADLMTVINFYAGYNCDRQAMPFKPWLRWARYDLAGWAMRAGVRADRLRARSALSRSAASDTDDCLAPSRRAACVAGDGSAPSRRAAVAVAAAEAAAAPPPDTATRRRMSNASTARKALAARAERDGVADAPPRIARSAIDPLPPSLGGRGQGEGSAREGEAPAEPPADSRQPTADSSSPPATMAEALMDLDDRWRSLLLAAGRGERHAVAQAAETISFWWGRLPESVTGPIDLRIAAWSSAHPGVAPAAADRRRVQALAPHLTARGSDLTAARIAARSLAR